MSEIPGELRYTNDHEWVRPDASSGAARIGITDFAQGALGDVVFVSLPQVGQSVSAGEAFGEVESTKSVSDVYAPLSGTIVARNEALAEHSELINTDPYGQGWLVEIAPADQAEIQSLLDAQAYAAIAE